MSETIERTIVKASAEDLAAGHQYIQEMIRFVQAFVSCPEPELAASNAALAYRALITGFANQGLMEIEWAPRIIIERGGAEFEVSGSQSYADHRSFSTSLL